MVEIGPYLLMGLIAIFGLGLAALIGFMVYSSMQDKKVKQTDRETPRADTLADQIKKQFHQEDARKERRIYTKSGVAKTSVKETRSIFSFRQDDAENEISLESEYDNGPEKPFLPPETRI
jgi:hypothetical protein